MKKGWNQWLDEVFEQQQSGLQRFHLLLTHSQLNATRKKHPEQMEYLPFNELMSDSLCFAGQVLPVLARSGLLDVREREGGRGRLHRPGGLHHTEVLYPIRECFYLRSMTKHDDPKAQLLFAALRFLPPFVNVVFLFPASQRGSQDPQTGHPAPFHQLA